MRNPIKITVLFLSFVLFLSCFGFSYANEPDNERNDIDISFFSSPTSESFNLIYYNSLKKYYFDQIEKAYRHLLISARRENFRGYCAMYVNNLLVYFGINKTYIKGNANTLFSLYSSKSYTDNGYFIEAISAKEHSLKEALSMISETNAPAEKIMVLFSKGATEKGKEFGHVFYVNAIINDEVIFSESSPSIFPDRTVSDGKPMALSIKEVCEKYEYYKFEGIICFTSISEHPSYTELWNKMRCCYTVADTLRYRRK